MNRKDKLEQALNNLYDAIKDKEQFNGKEYRPHTKLNPRGEIVPVSNSNIDTYMFDIIVEDSIIASSTYNVIPVDDKYSLLMVGKNKIYMVDEFNQTISSLTSSEQRHDFFKAVSAKFAIDEPTKHQDHVEYTTQMATAIANQIVQEQQLQEAPKTSKWGMLRKLIKRDSGSDKENIQPAHNGVKAKEEKSDDRQTQPKPPASLPKPTSFKKPPAKFTEQQNQPTPDDGGISR